MSALCKRTKWSVASIVNVLALLSAVELVRGARQVVVVGGGIAGLAAARYLTNMNSSTIEVQVLEARRERYGGRVWTDKLNNPRAKGVEVDLGGFALSGVPDNPLVQLAKEFELETVDLTSMQLIFPSTGKVLADSKLKKAFKKATEVLVNAKKMVQKYYYNDRSLSEAVDDELSLLKSDKELLTAILHSLPSYVLGNYSTVLYSPSRLDMGFSTVLKDGMGELLDRLVSGWEEALPLDVSLNTAVRQIKVDSSRGKVVVRLADRSQIIADQVIIAVPLAVLRAEKILFEPKLPRQYTQAIQEQGIHMGNKVVVEFEAPFWPKNVSVFLMAPEQKEDEGFLQTWVNNVFVVGHPSLAAMALGARALELESMSDEELSQTVLKQLSRIFGESAVSSQKLVKVLRSSWTGEEWSGGVGSYPTVGASRGLWDVFSKPVCPHIFFAGEHTAFEVHGTLHGAYISGIQAAKQVANPMTCQFANLGKEILEGKDKYQQDQQQREEDVKAETEKKRRQMKRAQAEEEKRKDEL